MRVCVCVFVCARVRVLKRPYFLLLFKAHVARTTLNLFNDQIDPFLFEDFEKDEDRKEVHFDPVTTPPTAQTTDNSNGSSFSNPSFNLSSSSSSVSANESPYFRDFLPQILSNQEKETEELEDELRAFYSESETTTVTTTTMSTTTTAKTTTTPPPPQDPFADILDPIISSIGVDNIFIFLFTLLTISTVICCFICVVTTGPPREYLTACSTCFAMTRHLRMRVTNLGRSLASVCGGERVQDEAERPVLMSQLAANSSTPPPSSTPATSTPAPKSSFKPIIRQGGLASPPSSEKNAEPEIVLGAVGGIAPEAEGEEGHRRRERSVLDAEVGSSNDFLDPFEFENLEIQVRIENELEDRAFSKKNKAKGKGKKKKSVKLPRFF